MLMEIIKEKNVTIDINAFKEYIELLRRDIYEAGAGVDMQSEKFGTAQRVWSCSSKIIQWTRFRL